MSETGDPREIELKLRIPPEELPRLIRHRLLRRFASGKPSRQRQVSTYFDTPDFRLMRAQVALRVRRIGSRRIQTVKCAPNAEDGIHSRREWEQEVDADRPVLNGIGNKQVQKLLHADKVGRHLAPQFVTDIERSTFPLELDGTSVEMAVDVGEIRTARGTVPVCEAELELKSGTLEGVYRMVQELHKTVPFTLELLSKAERGFALIAPTLPRARRADTLKLDRKGTVADAFQRIGRSCLLHLRANEAVVRATGDREGVHQFRVAIRRLRSALSAFRELLPKSECRRINAELRAVSQCFGRARDWDVFHRDVLAELRRVMGRDRALAAFAAAARHARRDAYKTLADTVASPEYTDVLLRLEAWWEGGTWQASLGEQKEEPARDFARRVLKKLDRRMRRLGERHAELEEADLHELRIRAKKLRYTCEFFRSLFAAKAATAYIDALAEIQDRLGSLNDAAVVRELLGEIERRNGIEKDLLVRADGIITGWNAARVAADLKRLPAAWQAFAELRPFWK